MGARTEAPATTATTDLPGPTKITVQVISREVQLPINEASLTAYTVPKAPEDGEPYSYEWKLVSFTRKKKKTSTSSSSSSSGPGSKDEGGDGSSLQEGNMKNSHSSKLELSGLEAGVYQFRVTVDSKEPQMHGEALANVTVLPRKSSWHKGMRVTHRVTCFSR